MIRLVLTRMAALVGVLLALTLAVFVIQTLLPADPIRASLGSRASDEQVAAKRAELGYDDPLVVQYGAFVGNVARGDLGDSLRTRRAVAEDVGTFLPATAELALVAAVLAGLLGVGLGLWSASGARGSGLVRTLMLGLASAPTFFVALLLILLLYRELAIFPASGRITRDLMVTERTGFLLVDTLLAGDLVAFNDVVKHLVMPAVCLALGPAVAIGRVLRGSLLDVLRLDHIRTARSKGLASRRIILRHALRNAAGPALSMAGLQVGLLLTGVVVIELVFAWPGIGLYTTQSIQQADFPAIIGIVLVLGMSYVIVNAIVDILQSVADPRLRAEGGT